MRRSALIALVSAGALWAFASAAKGPDDDKDRPGRGPRPHGSHARPAGSHPRPPGSLFPRLAGSVDLSELQRKHQAHLEELRARLAELRRTRQERREKRLEGLRKDYPPELLADARVRDELRVHARRMSRLRRAELVAKTELEEPRRSQVLARVKGLFEREEARHARRLAKLRSGAPSGGSAAPGSVAPAPKGSAP